MAKVSHGLHSFFKPFRRRDGYKLVFFWIKFSSYSWISQSWRTVCFSRCRRAAGRVRASQMIWNMAEGRGKKAKAHRQQLSAAGPGVFRLDSVRMKNHDIATAGNGNETLLICPGERAALRFLAQAKPLSHLQAFGQPLLGRWLEHLSVTGVRRVRILASDRPEQVRAMVGDGAQWGLVAEVIVEAHELTVEEARAKYRNVKALMVDHFPGLPEYPLFKSPAHWINGLRALFGHLATGTRGVREIKPGVWVSASARVSPDAELRAPCWIGPHTVVAGDTVIGPMAVLEDRVMVETGVSITNSAVAPETFVGRLAELKDSLVEGSLMINWRTGSCARVPDRGLMCPLGQRRGVFKPITFVSR